MPLVRRGALPVVWLLGLLVLSAPATALPWHLAPGLVSPGVDQRLHTDHPSIDSPNDLEALLRDVNSLQPTLRLEAYRDSAGWLLEGERGRLIEDVRIEISTNNLRGPLENLTRALNGQVDDPALRLRATEDVRAYLKKRGYPAAQVKLKVTEREKTSDYTFAVDEGWPCLIQRIELDFTLPENTVFDVASGDTCDEEAVQGAAEKLEQKLHDSGYGQARVQYAGMVYHPYANTADVRIQGALGKRVSYRVIATEKTSIVEQLFSDDKIRSSDAGIIGPEAMAAELVRRYKNQGYADVVVTGPRIEQTAPDSYVYTYIVEPGRHYLIKNVQFEGVTVFKRDELLSIMDLQSAWAGSAPLNPDDIRRGVEALKTRYGELGYWDAVVRDPRIIKDKESGAAQVIFVVNEGQPRLFDGLIVTGNTVLAGTDFAEFLRTKDDAPIRPGDPLDRAQLQAFEEKIQETYSKNGYLYNTVKVQLTSRPARRSIPTQVVVTLNEGPRVKIGAIRISGLSRTKLKVVQRELRFQTGDDYDPDAIDATRRALTGLGLFRAVDVVPTDRNAWNRHASVLDMTVAVREGKAGSISFGPGWSLFNGARFVGDFAYKNLGGEGRQVYLHGEINEDKGQQAIGPKTLIGRTFSAAYMWPWPADLPVDATISVSHRAAATNIWQIGQAGELALSHRLNLRLLASKIAAYYGWKINREEGSALQRVLPIIVDTGDVRIGQIGVRLNLDTRDDLAWPTKGGTLDSHIAWARYDFGGDLSFFNWEIDHNRYFGLWKNTVIAFGLSLSAYEDIATKGADPRTDVLPASEQLFAGGADTIRGFRERSLGPRVHYLGPDDNGNTVPTDAQLGGSHRTVFKTELRYQFLPGWSVAAFSDMGNTFFTTDEVQRFQNAYGPGDKSQASLYDNAGYDLADLLKHPSLFWQKSYESYGLSLGYLTPLGSLSVAYGMPWHEPDGHQVRRGLSSSPWITRGVFHINVGATF